MSSIEVNALPDEVGNRKREMRKEIGDFVKLIVWFLLLFFFIRIYIIEGYEVQGPSMIPYLNDRERILVLKAPQLLSQFRLFSGIDALDEEDIVVFDSPDEAGKRYVKRMVVEGPRRTPGNKVDAQKQGEDPVGTVLVCFDHGTVYKNNKRLVEEYLEPDQRKTDDPKSEVVLTPGTYYVLGDNRNVSKDSRSFGSIEDAHVVGKAILCFWPPSKIRLLQ